MAEVALILCFVGSLLGLALAACAGWQYVVIRNYGKKAVKHDRLVKALRPVAHVHTTIQV